MESSILEEVKINFKKKAHLVAYVSNNGTKFSNSYDGKIWHHSQNSIQEDYQISPKYQPRVHKDYNYSSLPYKQSYKLLSVLSENLAYKGQGRKIDSISGFRAVYK